MIKVGCSVDPLKRDRVSLSKKRKQKRSIIQWGAALLRLEVKKNIIYKDPWINTFSYAIFGLNVVRSSNKTCVYWKIIFQWRPREKIRGRVENNTVNTSKKSLAGIIPTEPLWRDISDVSPEIMVPRNSPSKRLPRRSVSVGFRGASIGEGGKNWFNFIYCRNEIKPGALLTSRTRSWQGDSNENSLQSNLFIKFQDPAWILKNGDRKL